MGVVCLFGRGIEWGGEVQFAVGAVGRWLKGGKCNHARRIHSLPLNPARAPSHHPKQPPAPEPPRKAHLPRNTIFLGFCRLLSSSISSCSPAMAGVTGTTSDAAPAAAAAGA